MSSVIWPGFDMVITPPQIHVRQAVSFKAGKFTSGTVGAPVTQGAGVFGTQGIGVKTPAAAVVADAVAGNAAELHTPNGGMFTMGLWSMMLPASMLPDITIFGVAMKDDGAAPKVHFIMAPVTTCFGKTIPRVRIQLARYRSSFRRIAIVLTGWLGSAICPSRGCACG